MTIRSCAIIAVLCVTDYALSQTADLKVQSSWDRPCIRVRCATGCSSRWASFFKDLGTAILWGEGAPGSQPSGASFIARERLGLPTEVPVGAITEVGFLSVFNGSTFLDSNIGSVVLNLEFTGLNVCNDPAVDQRAFCIGNTPNRTGDPKLDKDFYLLPGLGKTVTVPENDQETFIVWGIVNPCPMAITTDEAATAVAEPEEAFEVELLDLEPLGSDGEVFPFVDFRLDIKPGSCPNPFLLSENSVRENRGAHGVTTVALVGTPETNVQAVDTDSLEMVTPNGARIPPLSISFEDVSGAPESAVACECDGGFPDGEGDLVMKFDNRLLFFLLGSANDGDEVMVAVQGKLRDGTPFQASDCFWIVDRRNPAFADVATLVSELLPAALGGTDTE